MSRWSVCLPLLFWLWMALSGPSVGAVGPGDAPGPLDGSRQLVLVVSDTWDADHGVLRLFVRDAPGAAWIARGDAATVHLGKNGLAWGRGIAAAALPEDPVKREGDGRSPAGAFQLGPAFGSIAPDAPVLFRLPFHRIREDTSCIEDPESIHYNLIIDRDAVKVKDWKDADPMLRPDDLYRFGLLVRHNMDPVLPGEGSCIFFHIRKGDGPTSGCTAFSEADLLRVLTWLDDARSPVLVQLPRERAERLRESWDLP